MRYTDYVHMHMSSLDILGHIAYMRTRYSRRKLTVVCVVTLEYILHMYLSDPQFVHFWNLREGFHRHAGNFTRIMRV